MQTAPMSTAWWCKSGLRFCAVLKYYKRRNGILKIIRACPKTSSNILVANTEWRTILLNEWKKVPGTQERPRARFWENSSAVQLLTELDPSVFCPLWSFRNGKTRIYCQNHKRRLSHLYPYSSFVREGKTKPIPLLCQAEENQRTGSIAISTWILENPFILYSNSFPLFALNVSDLLLALGCGADPTGAPAVNIADNWSRLVLSWQGGDRWWTSKTSWSSL